MPIIIDKVLCDQSPDCPSVKWCISGALHHDPVSGKLEYDRETCSNCGTCMSWCGPGAIYFAETDEELLFLEEELRKTTDG
ncbi:MAG: hypothetical protein ACYC2T_01675 [Bacillota bacterium]